MASAKAGDFPVSEPTAVSPVLQSVAAAHDASVDARHDERADCLREAEAFYRDLFALEVAFREAGTPEGWSTLPDSADWDDAQRAGIDIGLVMLYRDGFRLAIEAADAVAVDGQLSHLGVFVDEHELKRLREAAHGAGCPIVVDRERALVIDDLFGVRWELNTFAYAYPPSLSTGARAGRWLSIAPTG